MPILWQDGTALVANKPSGVLVHNSAFAGPKETSLRQLMLAEVRPPERAAISETLAARSINPAADPLAKVVPLGLAPINRLDRGASGAVLFAWGADATRQWTAAWGAPETVKRYLVLVRGRLTCAHDVNHPLKDQRTGRIKAAHSEVTSLALSPIERCSLVQVRLHTGRRHQIRRHLKHLGHPVVGDTTWGDGRVNRHFRTAQGLNRLALHASSIRIAHPGSDEPIVVDAPLPPDFKGILARLFPELDLC